MIYDKLNWDLATGWSSTSHFLRFPEIINRTHLEIAHITDTMVTWKEFDYSPFGPFPQRGDILILYDYLFQHETGTKTPEKRPGMEIDEDDPGNIFNTAFPL